MHLQPQIYGSRGANGVVLITTKKGVKGQAKINAFFTRSVRSATRGYDVLDGLEYAQYQNEANLINGANIPFHIDGNNIYSIEGEGGSRVISDIPAETYNWQNEILQSGTSINFGGSISGGSDQGSYYLSIGYNDQNGLVDNSRFESGDIRFNLDRQVTDNLKVEARFSAFFSSF